jgi:hypothetical protein
MTDETIRRHAQAHGQRRAERDRAQREERDEETVGKLPRVWHVARMLLALVPPDLKLSDPIYRFSMKTYT